MADILIPREADRFVLYFDTPRKEVSALALAASLISLTDALRAANAVVNPGHEVDVVVEALPDGSFQAVFKTIFKSGKNLFSPDVAKQILIGLLTTYIGSQLFGSQVEVVVNVDPNFVVIETGQERIVIPRDVHEASQQAAKSETFKAAVAGIFEGAATDESVSGLGFKASPDRQRPLIYVPRNDFGMFRTRTEDDSRRERIVEVNLQIARAILYRGKRRWEFVWNGITISAPILDARFYDQFESGQIRIAPGDMLRVSLRIVQEQQPGTGIYLNTKYEVVEVLEHIPRASQPPIPT